MDIRPARAEDLESLNDLYNHYVENEPCTFDIDPISLDERIAWFGEFDGRRHRLLVADVDAQVVGYAYTKAHRARKAYDTSVESSVYIHRDHHGRGLGAALYEALFDGLGAEDVHRVYAGITMPNPASVALHEKFGFRQAGYFTEQGRKFDRYWDVAWFEKEI